MKKQIIKRIVIIVIIFLLSFVLSLKFFDNYQYWPIEFIIVGTVSALIITFIFYRLFIKSYSVCPGCNFTTKKNYKNCPDCGKELIKKCSECKAYVITDSKHCTNCGSSFKTKG